MNSELYDIIQKTTAIFHTFENEVVWDIEPVAHKRSAPRDTIFFAYGDHMVVGVLPENLTASMKKTLRAKKSVRDLYWPDINKFRLLAIKSCLVHGRNGQ